MSARAKSAPAVAPQAPVVSIAPRSAIDDALDKLRAHAGAVTTDATDRAARVVAAAGEYKRAVEGRIAHAMLAAAGLEAGGVPDVEGTALALLASVEEIPECAAALAKLREPTEPAAERPADLRAAPQRAPEVPDSWPDAPGAAAAPPPLKETGPQTRRERAAESLRAPALTGDLAGLTTLTARTALYPLVIVSTNASSRDVMDRLRSRFPAVEWVHVAREHGQRRVDPIVERVERGRVGALLACRAGMPHKFFDALKGAVLGAKTVPFASADTSSWGSLLGALRALDVDAGRVRS